MPVINPDASTTDAPTPPLNKPKYKPGDWVKVNSPGDVDHGRELQIEGLSPSTQKKRGRYKGALTWRYSLWGSDGYYNESELVPMEAR